MATITVIEDIVQSSVVSSTGVADWGNTVASDDSRATFTTSAGTNVIFELTALTYTPTAILEVQIRHESQAQAAATAVIQVQMLDGSNTQINTEFTSFAQTTDQVVTNLTTHTTVADGSTAFSANDIDTLRVKFTYITEAGAVGDALIDHAFVRVKYQYFVEDPYRPDPTITIADGYMTLSDGKITL